MFIRSNRRGFLAGSAVVALAMAGCAKAEQGTGGGSGKGGGEAIASTTNDMNTKDLAELAEGGDLRLANNAYPANWNTAHTDGNESNTVAIMEALMPSLYVYTADGKVVPNPEYTKRLDKVADSPLTIEIELKEGLKWSDGTPLDYKSIENNFKYLDGSHKDYAIASSEGFDKVEKIEKGANDYTAKVTFKELYADWMGLCGVMPDALVKDAKSFNEGWIAKPLVTCGPFKIGKLDPTNKTVQIVPDPAWTGTKPKLKSILFTTIEEPAAAATAYKNGQLDALETTVPAMYSVVKDMVGKGSELRKAAGPRWTHITLNGAKGRPMEDVKVRQAVQHAINREECFLSVNATMPYPKDMPQLNNHILMSNQDGYKDNSGDWGKFDVEKSKKLLEEAGYTFEGGKAMKDGKQLAITYVYNDGSKTNEAVVPVVQEALKQAGIDMKVQKVPPTDLFSKYVIPGQFDLTLFGWNGNPFLSSGDAIWKTDGEQNFGKTGTPEIDKIVDQAAVETDAKKRVDLINQYDAMLWEQAGTVPLWQSYDFFVQDKDLANYGAAGMARIHEWHKVGFVKGSPKAK